MYKIRNDEENNPWNSKLNPSKKSYNYSAYLHTSRVENWEEMNTILGKQFTKNWPQQRQENLSQFQ